MGLLWGSCGAVCGAEHIGTRGAKCTQIDLGHRSMGWWPPISPHSPPMSPPCPHAPPCPPCPPISPMPPYVSMPPHDPHVPHAVTCPPVSPCPLMSPCPQGSDAVRRMTLKVEELQPLAQRLGCSVPQLAIGGDTGPGGGREGGRVWGRGDMRFVSPPPPQPGACVQRASARCCWGLPALSSSVSSCGPCR